MLMSIIIFVFFLLCVFNKEIVYNTTLGSIDDFIKYTFPAIFMPFILYDLISNTKIVSILSKRLLFIKKAFKLKYDASVYIIIMSLICGAPSNAKLINDQYLENNIDINEANYLLKITSTTTLFFWIPLASFLFDSIKLTLFFIGSHFIANIFLAFIYRFFYKNENINKSEKTTNSISYIDKLNSSIIKTMNILIWILGFNIFFKVILNLFYFYFKLDLSFIIIIDLLYEHNNGLVYFLNSILKNVYIAKIVLISTAILSFQTLVEIKIIFNKVNIISYFKSRLIYAIISFIIFSLFLIF